MPNAIIVGCATGMGNASARRLADKGFQLGLADYQIDSLNALANELPGNVTPVKWM